ALLVFAALVGYGLVLPLRRRVSDSQVALYLEERDPSLEAAIMSAVDAVAATGQTGDHGPSPQLIDRLVEQAIDQCRNHDARRLGVEHHHTRRHAATLAAVAGAALLLVVFGPEFLRHGMSALLILYRSAEAASPYHILVQPGDAKVPRGSDQTISAKLQGFSAKDASLMVRTDPRGAFERLALVPGKDPAAFEGMLFHLEKTTEYRVEANGVVSPTYTMTVVELPTVGHLVLEYHFPTYTGLQPRTIDPGGDVAAIKGTEVLLKITPTMTTPGGSVLLNEKT